ncbi:MAG: NfeD family protein [Rhizobiaceae bacterium]
MILQFIADMGAWSWFIGGLILLIGEVIIPGTFLVWFGLAAILIGTVTIVALPEINWWSWKGQMVAFGLLSLSFVFLAKRMFPSDHRDDEAAKINDPLRRFLGQEAVLLEAIENGAGRVRLGDTTWRVRGEDLPVGTQIKVTGAEDGALLVVPL